MNIAVHGNVYICMSQDLTETFNIKSCLYAAGGEGMTQTVEIYIFYSADFCYFSETVLHIPGFYVLKNSSCQ